MKTINRRAIIAAVALAAAFCLGASSSKEDRPAKLPEDLWIPINPNAGFVILSRPSREHPVLRTQLWVRTGQNWMLATVEGPIGAVPLAK